MTIIDSSVWIDFLGTSKTPHSTWLAQNLGRAKLAITDLILCEVLQGIRDDAVFQRTRDSLVLLDTFQTAGQDLAVASAMNYRTLRRRGLTVRKTIDCLIATYCLREGHLLLHRDRDFDLFEEHLGLAVVHP